jgi:hypothetical protein
MIYHFAFHLSWSVKNSIQSFIIVASFFPHRIPNMQKQQLNATYNPPFIYCFFSNKLKASRENVENVVKPPHTPVFQKRMVLSDTFSRLLVIPTTNPISMAPRIFVIRVNIGK